MQIGEAGVFAHLIKLDFLWFSFKRNPVHSLYPGAGSGYFLVTGPTL